jgi:RNA polymerase II-associated factor 1
MESHGDHFLSYYLTKDDESALEYRRRRLREGDADADEEVSYLLACVYYMPVDD